MYARWAEKHGFMGRVVEKYPFKDGGVRLATIEFESEYMYGYLLGERGTHRMVCNSPDGSGVDEVIIFFLFCKFYALLSFIVDHEQFLLQVVKNQPTMLNSQQ